MYKQSFALSFKGLSQEKLEKKLLKYFEISETAPAPYIYNERQEELTELLRLASRTTLVRVLYNPYMTYRTLSKLWVLQAIYPKDKYFPYAVDYKVFEESVSTMFCLRYFCQIAWYRHSVNKKMRKHMGQWINDYYPYNDAKLCHALLDSYMYGEGLPMHNVLRIIHVKPRSPTISAMFGWLTGNCSTDQFNLLEESVQQRINQLTLKGIK